MIHFVCSTLSNFKFWTTLVKRLNLRKAPSKSSQVRIVAQGTWYIFENCLGLVVQASDNTWEGLGFASSLVSSPWNFISSLAEGCVFFASDGKGRSEKRAGEKNKMQKLQHLKNEKHQKMNQQLRNWKKYHQRSSTTSFGVSFVFLSLPLSVSDHLCLCLFVFCCRFEIAKETRKAYCSWKKDKMKKNAITIFWI